MKPKQTGRFKQVGADILRPKSMKDLLEDKAPEQEPPTGKPAGMHNCTDAQGTTSARISDARLHVFIKGTLEDQLISEVYQRKKSGVDKTKASKRGGRRGRFGAFFQYEKNGSNPPGI